jgi:hypothetical protein
MRSLNNMLSVFVTHSTVIYSVRLSVHEDVTPRGVNPPLQLLLPLNLTIVVNRRRHRRRRLRRHCCRRRLSAAAVANDDT